MPRFELLAKPECGKVLLTWESVPGSVSYKVYANGREREVVSDGSSVYLFDEAQDGILYTFEIESYGKDGNMLAKSILAKAKAFCFEEFECETTLKFILSNKMYWVNDTQKGPMPMPPLISKGRTFLVIRYITEELGAGISWDGKQRKVTVVTFRGKVIELWIGNNIAKVDGVETPIDPSDSSVVPFIESGRTLLPMRFVSEQMGAKDVVWDDEEKSIRLYFNNESVCTKAKITLEVDTVDCENGNVIAKDSFGNNYNLEVSGDCSYEKGDPILVDGVVKDVTREDDKTIIDIGGVETENIKEGQLLKGEVTRVEKTESRGILSLNTCDKVHDLSFMPGLANLENIYENSWIWVNAIGTEIVSWGFITNESHCGLTPEITTIAVNSINFTSEGFTTTGDDSSHTISGFYFDSTLEISTFPTEGCLEVTYVTNWLGRKICLKVEPVECPCLFEMIPIEEEKYTIYTGTSYTFEFAAKNTGAHETEYHGFVYLNYLNADVSVYPEYATAKPGEEAVFTMTIYADDFEALKKVEYGIECGETMEIRNIMVEVIRGNAEYAIDMPNPVILPNNAHYFRIQFTFENKSNATVKMQATANPTQAIAGIEMVPSLRFLKPYEKIEVTMYAELRYARVVGETIQLPILIRCNSETEVLVINFKITTESYPDAKLKITKIDSEKDIYEIDGTIDWGVFVPAE